MLKAGVSAFGDPEVLGALQLISMFPSFLFSEIQEAKGRSLGQDEKPGLSLTAGDQGRLPEG